MESESTSFSPFIDSPAKYREIEEDSSQSQDGFSTSLLRRQGKLQTKPSSTRTPKRKLLNETRKVNENAKSIQGPEINDVFEDSPTKYQAIDDVDSDSINGSRSPNANTQSTGYGLGLEDFQLQLQRTPPTVKRRPSSSSSLSTSFMLRRFLAESPKTPATDIFDESPSKSPRQSQLSQKFYNTPPRKILIEDDLDLEVTIIPESPSIHGESESQKSLSVGSCWKKVDMKSLETTPPRRPPMKKTMKINSRRLNFQREMSSEEILEVYSPEGHGQSQECIPIPLSLTPNRSNRSCSRLAQVQADSMEITMDDSPSKSELDLQLQRDRQNSKLSLSKTKLNLSGQLKRAVAQHNFTLRCWASKSKIQKLGTDSKEILLLLITKIHKLSSAHEKSGALVLLALCVELDKSSDNELTWKWVIFKTTGQNHKQFIPGLSAEDPIVKIHSPWQKIFLPSLSEEVVICTDFVEFVNSAQVHEFSSVKSSIQQAKIHIDLKFASFLKYCPSQPNLLPLIPYKILNDRTIQKQILLHRRSIELEVVVCQVWSRENERVGVLVKDSDEILSYVEASSSIVEGKLIPGTFLRISGLSCPRRVTPHVSLQLFSVISTFGHKQMLSRYYYKLLSTKETKWEIFSSLEIPFNGCNCTEINVKELVEVPITEPDRRFHVDGKICLPESSVSTSTLTPTPTPLTTKLNPGVTEFYLHDVDDSNIRIKVKILPSFGSDRILTSGVNLLQFVQLGFLRLFRGIATLDQFSSIKQLE